jgi:ABC-type lipoprotein release transport system permease subunit
MRIATDRAHAADATTVVAIVAAASLAACWRPAAQAMRVDPAMLLREE